MIQETERSRYTEEYNIHNKKELIEAMRKAEEAFSKYIEGELGFDGAYFDIEIHGYSLSVDDFQPLNHVVFEATHKAQKVTE